MKIPSAIPEIPVGDLAAALAYYQEKLDFKLDWGGEAEGIAGISSGECRLFLTSDAYREGRGNAGPVFVWLNLESKAEVDALYQRWHAQHARVVASPESKPWGLHEFTVADLDRNLIRAFYDLATPSAEA